MSDDIGPPNGATADARQLASLLRVLLFVRDGLDSVEADFPSYCAALAIEAIVVEIMARGVDPADVGIRGPFGPPGKRFQS